MENDKLKFGQRFNDEQIEKIFQVKSMDRDLRIALYNTVYLHFFRQFQTKVNQFHSNMQECYEQIWMNILNKPLDEYPPAWQVATFIKGLILEGHWTKPYQFIEDLFAEGISLQMELKKYGNKDKNFVEDLNLVLNKFSSGYTFFEPFFIQVTNKEEIHELRNLADNLSRHMLHNINEHFQTALELIATRPEPEFRKVIHECICMVEAVAKLIEPGAATLSDALKKLKESGFDLHPALNSAFQKMYAYTGDADGIRHNLKFDQKSDLDMEDARFFLIACSAFTNYLIVKAQKADIIK